MSIRSRAWLLSALWLLAASGWWFLSSLPLMAIPCVVGAGICAGLAITHGGVRARGR